MPGRWTQDFLEVWELSVDWINPVNSTFTLATTIDVAEFDSDLCGLLAFACAPQPGTGTTLDPLREPIMWRLVYRNFGGGQRLVGNFVTDATGADAHAIRWFELRNTGAGWSLFQEGTLADSVGQGGAFDDVHRWMGSLAMDGSGNIALAYSVSNGSTVNPGMRYNGRLAGDTAGQMPQGEQTIVNGTTFNDSNRWGDYSSMSIDPSDDCTFWHTNNYATGNQDWQTRVATFDFGSDCTTPSLADITVTKTDTLLQVGIGQPIAYTIHVSNTGFTRDTNISFVDNFPPEIDPTSINWTCAVTGTGSCSVANGTGNIALTLNLDAGAFATIDVTALTDLNAVPGTFILQCASAFGIVSDVNAFNNQGCDTNTQIIGGQADLSIFKSDGLTTIAPGDPITYTIDVNNPGPSIVSNATIIDNFPAEILSPTWTCAITIGTGNCDDPGPTAGNINTTVDLDVGATATFTVTGTVDPTATNGTVITNTATVTAPQSIDDQNQGNNTTTDTTTVDTGAPPPDPDPDPGPTVTDPGISKVGVLGPGQLGLPGEQITWTITVNNPSSQTLTNVVISDTFIPELQIDSATSSAGSVVVNNQTVTVTISITRRRSIRNHSSCNNRSERPLSVVILSIRQP